jgi:hypothetical protein
VRRECVPRDLPLCPLDLYRVARVKALKEERISSTEKQIIFAGRVLDETDKDAVDRGRAAKRLRLTTGDRLI